MTRPDPIFILFLAVCACSSEQSERLDGGHQHLPLDVVLSSGEVRAGIIEKKSELLHGPEAQGWIGDFKLYNDRAAFIVQGLDDVRGWGPYGGSLLDASPLLADGTSPPEVFQEIFVQANLMAFNPTDAKIVSDGTDGRPAMLRLTGHLQGIPAIDAALGGLQPPAMDVVQEFELAPDSSYLLMRTKLTTGKKNGLSVQLGDAVFNGDLTTDAVAGTLSSSSKIPQGEHPWFMGFNKDTCNLYASLDHPIKSAFSLHEIQLITAKQGIAPYSGSDAEPLTAERILLVGLGGMDPCLSAWRTLSGTGDTGEVFGSVHDTSGNIEPGAEVTAFRTDKPEGYNLADQVFTDKDGNFSMRLDPGTYTITVKAEARDIYESEEIVIQKDQHENLPITIPEPGHLSWNCTEVDHDGTSMGPVPCKISLQHGTNVSMSAQVDRALLTFSPDGSGQMLIPPGQWTITLSRGWEYSIHRRSFSISPGQNFKLRAALQRQVNTDGFVAIDIHTHCTKSIDSTYLIDDKIASNLSEGVEIVVITDHDCQTDFSPYIDELKTKLDFDLDKWLVAISGNEISPLIGHSTAFPLPVHPTGWVYNMIPWTEYVDGKFSRQLEFPEIWNSARQFGAKVINLAHPLSYAAWFTYLGFNPPDVIPRLDELPKDKFAPTFDTIELLNKNEVDVMLNKVLPVWNSMNNQGVFKTAVGVSDSHSRDAEAGFGRTLVRVQDDHPSSVKLDDVWKGLKSGRAMVGGGVFVWIRSGDSEPGDLAENSHNIHIRVEAADWVSVDKLQLIANGDVIKELSLPMAGEVDTNHPALRYDEDIEISPQQDTWYAALVYGKTDDTLDPVFIGCRPIGMTNAIRMDVDGDGVFTPPDK